jgi:hypothetical protein
LWAANNFSFRACSKLFFPLLHLPVADLLTASNLWALCIKSDGEYHLDPSQQVVYLWGVSNLWALAQRQWWSVASWSSCQFIADLWAARKLWALVQRQRWKSEPSWLLS